jgi:hypothetical protein
VASAPSLVINGGALGSAWTAGSSSKNFTDLFDCGSSSKNLIAIT